MISSKNSSTRKKQPLQKNGQSFPGKVTKQIPLLLLLLMLGLVGWFGLASVEQQSKMNLAHELTMDLGTNVEALRIWNKNMRAVAETWANETAARTEIIRLVNMAAQGDSSRAALLRSAPLTSLRKHLGPICRTHDFIGFVLFNSSKLQIGALLDEPVGRRRIVRHSDFITRALSGETLVSLPFVAEIDLPDIHGTWKPNRPTMFVSTPVRNLDGQIVAVLAFRIRPEIEFTHVLEISRTGETHETYAFDKHGLLLSCSRFKDDLRRIGLIPDHPESQTILNIEVRDPGGNMLEGFRPQVVRKALPLTRMAASAVKGESGCDVNGYRDYRGAAVIGAWTWLPEFGFGIATEVGKTEAFTPLVKAQRTFLRFFSLLVFASVIGLILQIRQRKLIARSRLAEENRLITAKELENQKFALDEHSIVAITDRRGRITYINDKFCEISKYSRKELIGQDHRIVNSGHHPKTFWKQVWVTIGRGEVWKGEVKNRCKDGTCYWVYTTIVPFMNSAGEPYQYVAIRTDITERKRMQEELAESNRFLQQVLNDTKELALRAEEANMAKSEFLANMSHELRTPMNGIIGMTAILLDTRLTSEQRGYAETVRGSAESLLTIINDILDFSKIENGKLDLEFIDFDLRTCIEEVADLLAFKAEEKGLVFSCFLHPRVDGFVNGDPGRLKQILINLADNAVKFTKQGEVAISGDLERETETEIRIRFSVTDTGIGIPRKAQQKLFQSFSQVDASSTRKFGGTGLGLTISKQLAEMMGGKIGVESPSTQLRTSPELSRRAGSEGFTLSHVEGKGSTFWFTVILKKQPVENCRRQVKDIDLTGKRILVIDKNTTNRTILRLQLQSWHCFVEEAEDATEALRLLHRQVEQKAPIEIAFVDMQMPGMDGETLGIKIKHESAIQDTKLIMITSIGQRGDAKRMSEIGFAAYLTKPLKRSQLYDCLIAVLNDDIREVGKIQLVTKHTIAENQKLNLKILLAEDNLVNQKVATKMLQKLGCQVDVAANGKEAVEMVQNSSYDLLFMDCQMPEMDGFTATTEIRKQKNPQSKIPIIAMTANAMDGDRDKCLEAGMDYYISKPVTKIKLVETLLKLPEKV